MAWHEVGRPLALAYSNEELPEGMGELYATTHETPQLVVYGLEQDTTGVLRIFEGPATAQIAEQVVMFSYGRPRRVRHEPGDLTVVTANFRGSTACETLVHETIALEGLAAVHAVPPTLAVPLIQNIDAVNLPGDVEDYQSLMRQHERRVGRLLVCARPLGRVAVVQDFYRTLIDRLPQRHTA